MTDAEWLDLHARIEVGLEEFFACDDCGCTTCIANSVLGVMAEFLDGRA